MWFHYYFFKHALATEGILPWCKGMQVQTFCQALKCCPGNVGDKMIT